MAFAEALAEALMRFTSSQLFVYRVVVDDVVAVFAAWSGLQIRGTIEVGDPELLQIIRNTSSIVEAEFAMQLYPIGSSRNTGHLKLRAFNRH